jgi:hypothetical protein
MYFCIFKIGCVDVKKKRKKKEQRKNIVKGNVFVFFMDVFL